MNPWRFAARSKPVTHTGSPLSSDAINLRGGFAWPENLPDISREAMHAATAFRHETMQYTSVTGLAALREAIAQEMSRDCVPCKSENILIVNGAKQGLDLACRIFLEPGDGVIVTAPTYMGALAIFRSFDARLLAVSQDDEGINTAELAARLESMQRAGLPLPKLLYDVPDFHNPTGVTTSARRRRTLVALAQRYGFVIIADNPYGKIRFEGEAVAPVSSFDHAGVVITLGTASKILAPGLRLGWVVATPEIVARMAAQKSEGDTSAYLQRIFGELLENGQVANHIQNSIATLKHHRDAMLAALARHLPQVTVKKPAGGYYLWAELPPGHDGDALAELALQHGVAVYAGSRCQPMQENCPFLRLCYSFNTPALIDEGIKRLARAFAELQSAVFDSAAYEKIDPNSCSCSNDSRRMRPAGENDFE